MWSIQIMYNVGKTAQVVSEMDRNKLAVLGKVQWTQDG